MWSYFGVGKCECCSRRAIRAYDRLCDDCFQVIVRMRDMDLDTITRIVKRVVPNVELTKLSVEKEDNSSPD